MLFSCILKLVAIYALSRAIFYYTICGPGTLKRIFRSGCAEPALYSKHLDCFPSTADKADRLAFLTSSLIIVLSCLAVFLDLIKGLTHIPQITKIIHGITFCNVASSNIPK